MIFIESHLQGVGLSSRMRAILFVGFANAVSVVDCIDFHHFSSGAFHSHRVLFTKVDSFLIFMEALRRGVDAEV